MTMMETSRLRNWRLPVIPAKAGIQRTVVTGTGAGLDSRLRGNDEKGTELLGMMQRPDLDYQAPEWAPAPSSPGGWRGKHGQ